MSDPSLPGLRSALAAATHARIQEGCVDGVLRLYIALVLAANDRGRVIRTRERLARDLSLTESAIDDRLARLSGDGLITITSPSPYLVIAIRFWSAESLPPSRNAAENHEERGSVRRVVPVSKQLLAAAATPGVAAACGEGGAGEGAGLLAEALVVLGTDEKADLPTLIARYPAPIVRRALRRVQLTPMSRIRTSKVALFRFLLNKLSHEPHAQPPHSHDRS